MASVAPNAAHPPLPALEQNFTQPVVEWIREWEDAGGLWKIIVYAAAFFMMIACIMTVVGSPLFVFGAIEYGRQNSAAMLGRELEEARRQARAPRGAIQIIDPQMSSPLRRRTEQVADLSEQLADAQRERDELGRELAITRLEPQVFTTQSLLEEVADLTHLRGDTTGSLTEIARIAGALKAQFSEPEKFIQQISAIETLAQSTLAQVRQEISERS